MAIKLAARIPSAGPALGLWATIASCEQQGITDIQALINGQPIIEPHTKMDEYGIKLLHSDELLIPPQARNVLTLQGSDADYYLFLDDHVICPSGIAESIENIKWRSGKFPDIWHCSYRPCVGLEAPRYYHFFGIRSWVDGDYATKPLNNNGLDPYKTGSATHNCFAVRREVWEKLGGYWGTYEGFGGEEASFDLWAWAQGHEVWLDPNIQAWHYSARADQRGYEKTINPANYHMAMERLAPFIPQLKMHFESEGIPYVE